MFLTFASENCNIDYHCLRERLQQLWFLYFFGYFNKSL